MASRRGFAPIIVILVVAIIAAAGGVWWYAHEAGSGSLPAQRATETATTAPVSEHAPAPATTSAANERASAPAAGSSASSPAPAPSTSCASQYADTAHMDIFDAHTHLISSISAAQIIAQMNAAGVGMANLYPIDGDDDSSSLAAMAAYPGRFITFVDTPDSPQPSTWLADGQTFVAHAEAQLKTGKFYGIGETNLRYYSGGAVTPPPDISVSPDNPLWLELVDLGAQYRVPVSFHFVPDDPSANALLEAMLANHPHTTFIWAHLGFNNMPLDSAALDGYLLNYPNLYFDTAGIQNMQNPLPQPNSNWARLTSDADNGRLNPEWRKFFETWNSRILFGSDAGGGNNGVQRWQNYAGNAVSGATPNAIGHWRTLFSNLDPNAARNILSANAKALFLKMQKPDYEYSASVGGNCYTVSIRSDSSVSAFSFDPSAKTISFTMAGSNGTAESAMVTMPAALLGANIAASVDGASAKSSSVSNPDGTITISVNYSGGIRSIVLSAR